MEMLEVTLMKKKTKIHLATGIVADTTLLSLVVAVPEAVASGRRRRVTTAIWLIGEIIQIPLLLRRLHPHKRRTSMVYIIKTMIQTTTTMRGFTMPCRILSMKSVMTGSQQVMERSANHYQVSRKKKAMTMMMVIAVQVVVVRTRRRNSSKMVTIIGEGGYPTWLWVFSIARRMVILKKADKWATVDHRLVAE